MATPTLRPKRKRSQLCSTICRFVFPISLILWVCLRWEGNAGNPNDLLAAAGGELFLTTNHNQHTNTNSAQAMEAQQVMAASGANAFKPHHCLNSDFQPSQAVSVWTMLNDNKDYVRGAVKLGAAVQRHTTIPIDLVVMELEHKLLTEEEWVDLKKAGWQRCTVPPIPAPAKTRPDLKEKFAVLHVWAMEVYDTVLFLDADTFVRGSIDSLLQMDIQGMAVGVTKDIRNKKWVSTFNSGVMLLHPYLKEHERLLQLLGSGLTFDFIMSDQGFLNEVYKDNWHEIGFVNNANLALYRFQRTFWEEHKLEDINIIHYTMQKPWKCQPTGPYGPLCDVWINAS